VRALRGVRISEEKSKKAELKTEAPVQKPTVNLGESLFGVKPSSGSSSANPFSTSSNPFSASANPFSNSNSKAAANPFAAAGLGSPTELAAKSPQVPSTNTSSDLPKTFASALSLNNDAPKFGPPPPPEPWPQETDLPPEYPQFYFVDTDYETLDKVENVPIPTQTMDLDESSGSAGGKEDKDVYESTIDTTFQKFADRLAQNPEQVIRYEFKGQPLLYSKKDVVGKMLAGGKENVKVKAAGGMPRCGNCGSGRVFEVQLTPHVITELESEAGELDGMEWGTIIVGVCERDCSEKGVVGTRVGYVEEWAGVQWEEVK
jgi:pre-rRNA-processing protein TSR4